MEMLVDRGDDPVMWHERLKKAFRSDRKAAARLFPIWKKLAREEVDRERSTQQALANRLGMLHRHGDSTGWWEERPELCQQLADLVEMEVGDIFRPRASPPDVVAFREFPALPPLRHGDSPSRTSSSGSVFEITQNALRMARSRHWIRVPPGGGKSLTIALLLLHYPAEVTALTVTQLRRAGAPDPGSLQPLVVEVEEPDPEHDARTLAALESLPVPVVILAAFDCPLDHAPAGSLSPSPSRVWRTINGAPVDGWLERMLVWITERLDRTRRDTKLDKEVALAWQRRNPGVAQEIQTPGDLLALCADLDQHGDDGSARDRATRWLETVGVRSLPPDTPATWRDHASMKSLREMIQGNLTDQARALGHRPFEHWAELVPERARPRVVGDAPGALMAVSYLRAGGLLRASRDGYIGFPVWVAKTIEQQRVHELFKETSVSTWGLLAGDQSRQKVIDDALDALPVSGLRKVARQQLETMPTQKKRSFAQVAAMEATVAALARRLTSVKATEEDAALGEQLLDLQLQHLVSGRSVGEYRRPTTRRERNEWFLTGWAISLSRPDTRTDVPEDLRWILPGWARQLRLAEVKHHWFPWSTLDPWGASEPVRRLALLAEQVLERLERQPIPRDVPRLILPALLLAEAWELEPKHLEALAGSWDEVFFASALGNLDASRKPHLAALLWDLAGKTCSPDAPAPVAERLMHLRLRHAPLVPFVVEHLLPDVVNATAREAGTHRRYGQRGSCTTFDPEELRLLGPASRTAAVRGWLAMDRAPAGRFDEARELVRVLDGDDLELVLDVIRNVDGDVAAEFASRIWSALPRHALEESVMAFDQGLASAEGWFHAAPREQLGSLLRHVEKKPLPGWLQSWALRRLLDAGPHAESLFRLASRQP